MTGTALLALISLGTVGGAHLLSRARWTWRTPRIGIALWQALGLCWGVATIGALLGLALLPYGKGVLGGLPGLYDDQAARLNAVQVAALLSAISLAGVLLVMLMFAVARVMRARRRHRALLALVSRRDSAVPGTLVLDHPGAAAYCVPGSARPRSSSAPGRWSCWTTASWPRSSRTSAPTPASGTTWSCCRSRRCARCSRSSGWSGGAWTRWSC